MDPLTFVNIEWVKPLLKMLNNIRGQREKEVLALADVFGDPRVMLSYYVVPNCQHHNPADHDEDERSRSYVKAPVYDTLQAFLGTETLMRDGRNQCFILADAGRGGTVGSVDPIALLRGAPNREAAEAFIEYTLTMEGQKLWNFKPGTPGGPERFALRRLPVRKDFYAREDWKAHRSDPEAAPFDDEEHLVYQPEWTGGLFREMAFVIRILCLDTHDELTAAWREIIRAGSPPAALAMLSDLSAVNYDRMAEIRRRLGSKDKVDELRLAKELAEHFRRQYLRAAELARESSPAR